MRIEACIGRNTVCVRAQTETVRDLDGVTLPAPSYHPTVLGLPRDLQGG